MQLADSGVENAFCHIAWPSIPFGLWFISLNKIVLYIALGAFATVIIDQSKKFIGNIILILIEILFKKILQSPSAMRIYLIVFSFLAFIFIGSRLLLAQSDEDKGDDIGDTNAKQQQVGELS